MHDVMTLRREVGSEVTRLAVGGEVDLAGGRELRDAMEQAALDRAAGVELDLREVSFLDSSGLAAVLGGARVLDAHGCALRTESPHGSEARLVIEMAGVGKLLGLTA
jgi:anti-sigma B factor antagonist